MFILFIFLNEKLYNRKKKKNKLLFLISFIWFEFPQVGHSLLTLRMSHALSPSVSEIPKAPFKFLTNLQHFDFSNNKIKSLPDTSFHFLKRIKRMELQDNEIDSIRKGTFQVFFFLFRFNLLSMKIITQRW